MLCNSLGYRGKIQGSRCCCPSGSLPKWNSQPRQTRKPEEYMVQRVSVVTLEVIMIVVGFVFHSRTTRMLVGSLKVLQTLRRRRMFVSVGCVFGTGLGIPHYRDSIYWKTWTRNLIPFTAKRDVTCYVISKWCLFHVINSLLLTTKRDSLPLGEY